MFCGVCGTENPDTNQFCNNCGKPLKKKQLQPEPVPAQGPTIPKKPDASKKWVIIGAVIAVVIIAGAFVLMQPGSPMKGVPAPAPAAKPSEVVHGTISTGSMTTAAQGSVAAAGGTITVKQPGSAIDGLVFTAPAGVYPSGQQVTISSSPITGNTFGSNFNPATPMISIDAGKDYAEEPVLVKIPVTIPADQFAMAFYYDDVNKKLEGIPTAGQDGKSLTITTRHFSNILVSLISLSSLDGIKKVDSGFRPGVDDWEFVNDGSFIAPDGNCAGQSATMMWYFTEQRQKNGAPALNGRFDNNGREKTPLIARDNTLGYRFASVMQAKTSQKAYWENPGSIISNVSDSNTFMEFKYSMLLTGEPQFVSIFRTGGGHAIVCYEVSDNTLWIADPNYPGKERMIQLNGSTLGPYTSGASSQDIKQNGVRIYPTINYVAKTAFFSWPTLATEYAKVQDGTIGNDLFPPYQLEIIVYNDDGTKETFKIDGGKNQKVQRIEVKGNKAGIWPKGDSYEAWAGDVTVYSPDGNVLEHTPTKFNPVVLKEGSNMMAVELVSTTKKAWLGFDWIDLVYGSSKPATKAITTQAPPAGAYTMYRYAIKNPVGGPDQTCLNEGGSFYSENDPLCGKPEMLWDAPQCGKPSDRCTNYSTNTGGIVEILSYIHYKDPNEKQYHQVYVGYLYKFLSDGSDLYIRSHWKLIETPNNKVSTRTEECVPNTVAGLRAIDPKLPYTPESGKYACKPEGSNELNYINTI
jgi:hypothetical protein